MKKDRTRIILLDTHAILHRAYHALPDFSSSKGEATGALYGLITMLVRIIGDLKPDAIIAAYDLPKPTHRHVAFDGYKAKRPKTEEDLVSQINRSRDVLTAFGIPIYAAEGFEADDVLGTLVEKLKGKKDTEIIIASGDMDTLQLVDEKKVQVYTLKRGLSDTIMYDEDGVKARFGFPPELLPDYKGLRGDPSDNIPGVKGIGEKTATILIKEFGSLDALYKTLKGKGGKEKVIASGVSPRIVELLLNEEEEARFSKELALIRRDAPIDYTVPGERWRESLRVETLKDLLYTLEFRSLVPRVMGLFGTTPLALSEEETEKTEEIPPEDVAEVALALWVADSNFTMPTLEDIYSFAKTRNFAEAKKIILEEVKKRKVEFVLNEIEKPLAPVLRSMERHGVRIDLSFLKDLSKTYHKELEKIALRIYKVAGGEFNINSPRQLAELLFDKLGLTVKNHKKTGTGLKSTRESELEKMRDMHPIVGDILAHRELQKLLSTYIDSIPTLVDKEGRLHTTFVQTGTTTGRLASHDPNLQNIPIKSDLGKAIRKAFIGDKGFEFVTFDYSQIELRVAAFLSEDEKLMKVFKEGGDIHAAVASQVFGVAPKEVTGEMRRRAKVINFGILYGMGVIALMQNLGVSRAEAQEFHNQYFKTYETLARYLEDTKAFAAKNGYVATHFGRRRYFEGIRSRIPYVRASAERMAINAPMQGTQSDIVKLAMIRINDFLSKERAHDDVRMLLQVHDELVFEIKEGKVEEYAPTIKEIMESVLPKKEAKGIPFVANGSRGKNWGELERIPHA